VELFVNDLRYALRQLWKTPLFSAAAIITLAVGIGATTAIFSTVNATLLRPLPFPKPAELVDVHSRLVDGRVTTGLLSAVEIVALNRLKDSVAGAAGVSNQPFNATLLRDDGTPAEILVNGVGEGFFDVMGLPLVAGRGFTREEHLSAGQNAPLFAVLSDKAWTNLFRRDPSIVGKAIRVAEVPAAVTVTGIAPPSLDFPTGTDIWFNIRGNPEDVAHVFGTVVRLRPGITIDRVRSEAGVAMAGLAKLYPSDVGREYVMVPLLSALVGDLGPTLVIVLAATALLLLLASVNVTNLLLARGTARTREVTVRTALGASRGRIVRQLLTESMVLATLGALAGLLLAFGAIKLLLALGASKLPRLDAVPFDERVLLFALAVLIFTGVTMGLTPASRLARADLRTLLNETSRTSSASRGTSRLMSGMIVVEIALAIALVAGAGWLVQSFLRLRSIDPGFVANGRLVIDVRPTRPFRQPEEARAWADEMMNRVRSASGDALIGSAATFPLRADRDGTLSIELLGEPPDSNQIRGAHVRLVSAGFFEAMGIKVVAGRSFTVDDRQETAPVVVVNRAFVRRYFPDSDPLAGSLAYGYPTVDRKTMSRIVGVVDDVRYKTLAEAAEPTFYRSVTQGGFPFLRPAVVVAPPAGRGDALISNIRAELQRFDPQMVATFTTADAIVAETLSRQELGVTLMLIFGGTALVLAAVGIYGVIAYGAAQRRNELATRLALGASGRQVFRLVMLDGPKLALAGLVLGLAAAYAGGRVLASNVYEMRAADPVILLAAGAVTVGMTLAATMIPAVVASRIDPVRALRPE